MENEKIMQSPPISVAAAELTLIRQILTAYINATLTKEQKEVFKKSLIENGVTFKPEHQP